MRGAYEADGASNGIPPAMPRAVAAADAVRVERMRTMRSGRAAYAPLRLENVPDIPYRSVARMPSRLSALRQTRVCIGDMKSSTRRATGSRRHGEGYMDASVYSLSVSCSDFHTALALVAVRSILISSPRHIHFAVPDIIPGSTTSTLSCTFLVICCNLT